MFKQYLSYGTQLSINTLSGGAVLSARGGVCRTLTTTPQPQSLAPARTRTSRPGRSRWMQRSGRCVAAITTASAAASSCGNHVT